jgi:hypothetical protein
VVAYLRPSFHPLRAADDGLARAVFDAPHVQAFFQAPSSR